MIMKLQSGIVFSLDINMLKIKVPKINAKVLNFYIRCLKLMRIWGWEVTFSSKFSLNLPNFVYGIVLQEYLRHSIQEIRGKNPNRGGLVGSITIQKINM